MTKNSKTRIPQQEESSNFAYPGKRLAVIEEYCPGDGVLCIDGILRAEVLGRIKIDFSERVVSIARFKELPIVKVGDEVIGRITELTGVYGVTKVEAINGKLIDRVFTAVTYPTRHLKENEKQYKPGDIIIAIVESLKNRMIHLSIKGSKYGVIQARCSVCGSILTPLRKGVESTLSCKRCGNKEKRKISDLYGSLEKILGTS